MTSTGPNVRTFLRFLTGRRTLLISAPFSRGVMFVLGNVIKPQGLEPLQFPTKFRSPSTHQGKMCCGRTPRDTFNDGIRIWKEKLIGDVAA